MPWSLPADAVIGLLAARPGSGANPRLASEPGAAFADQVPEAMTLDLAEIWASSSVLAPGGRRVLAFAPDDAGPWFDARVSAEWALQPQVGAELGTRMKNFFEGEFADGAKRVVLIGSDTPTLDPSIVISAFLTLESRDVVLGPATDGGYYLIGCRGSVPPIFEGIDWSAADVLAQTIGRLRDTKLSLGVLPPWYKVVTPADWRALRGHLLALRRAGLDPMLPRVETLIGNAG